MNSMAASKGHKFFTLNANRDVFQVAYLQIPLDYQKQILNMIADSTGLVVVSSSE